MKLYLDYDREHGWTTWTIVKRHRYLRRLIWDMGWWVDNITTYRSANHNWHVELDFHAVWPGHKHMAVVCAQAIFGSDGRRELFNISRIKSATTGWCSTFVDQDMWDLMWDEKLEGKGKRARWKKRVQDDSLAKRLRRLWNDE